jgi:uncharacterized membrane protein
MSNDKFSISEALQYGWETFRSHIGFFLGLMVVMAMLTIIPDVITEKLFEPRSVPFVICKLVTRLMRLIGLILGMVATRVSLDLHDTGEADLSRISELMPKIPAYLGSKILYGLIVFGGLCLLVVPGCIWAYMFLYAGFLVVDKDLGPIAALKESKAITYGYKWSLFAFSIVVALINIAGMICLLVGLLVTIPVTMMASAHVYRRLSPQGAASIVDA